MSGKKKGTISLHSSIVIRCSFYDYVSLLINDFSAGMKPSIAFQHSNIISMAKAALEHVILT